jgi:hypothetical protein
VSIWGSIHDGREVLAEHDQPNDTILDVATAASWTDEIRLCGYSDGHGGDVFEVRLRPDAAVLLRDRLTVAIEKKKHVVGPVGIGVYQKAGRWMWRCDAPAFHDEPWQGEAQDTDQEAWDAYRNHASTHVDCSAVRRIVMRLDGGPHHGETPESYADTGTISPSPGHQYARITKDPRDGEVMSYYSYERAELEDDVTFWVYRWTHSTMVSP